MDLTGWGGIILGLAITVSPSFSQPLRILSIGDSLTEEYRFETPFSGPKTEGSDVPAVNANTSNWPEILSERRSSFVSFGSYQPNLLDYGDFRNAGYKHNFGIPGHTTVKWMDIIDPQFEFSAYYAACVATQQELIEQLEDDEDVIGAVVIFLGGNDLKSDYSGIFNNAQPPALMQNAVNNLREIHEFVRDHNATVPIILCTMPDIGATPEVAGKYTDPANRVRARQRIAAANSAIIALGAETRSQIARIDFLTDRIFDEVPFYINGTVMEYSPDNANPPDHLFCHDGFHPSTSGQTVITNLILDAVNRATGRAIPLLSNREVLGDVLGLNPDQPYLDWAGAAGGMRENPDGDGSQNLVEFLFNTAPGTADTPFQFSADGTLSFAPSADRLRFASLEVKESTTLSGWSPVPAARVVIGPGGSWQVTPNGQPRNFYKLFATPKP